MVRKTITDREGQMIWGPLWTSRNLRNRGWNAGLSHPVKKEKK